jgi:hypothetical protein
VPEVEQVLDGGPRAGTVVRVHAVHALHPARDADHRDHLRQLAHAFVGVQKRRGDDDPHTRLDERVDGTLVLAADRAGDAEDEPVARLRQRQAHAVEDIRKDLVPEVQEVKPDGGAGLACQGGSCRIVPVSQTLGGIEDRLSGLFADTRGAPEGEGHQRPGDPDFARNISLGGWPVLPLNRHTAILPRGETAEI